MAIASTVRKRWVEIAWAAFAAANVVVIVMLRDWETIPFHFIWVSLTLVYGLRVWRLRTTMLLLLVVMAVTGAALAWTVVRGNERLDELTEVPLMAAMFVAIVWHAHRRQAAIEETSRLAESEHRLLERQREFVRDASHELRTPITVARGHAELIRHAGGDGQVAIDADVVLDELEHLSSLSERLLILTAAEDPAFLSRTDIEVEPLVVGLMRRWGPTAERTWQVRVGVDGTILADRERLETALDALMENAVEATDEASCIRVGCRGEVDTLVLEVTDQGRGICAEDLPRIFDPFSKIEPDRARLNGGTGLGLSIAKAIVDAHGGSIAVESAEGRGTTFRIRLPGLRPSWPDRSATSAIASDIDQVEEESAEPEGRNSSSARA
ncbi:MAG TPA: HAMP domain-containing sensor histidine kinase [Actinomycetota bacterium]